MSAKLETIAARQAPVGVRIRHKRRIHQSPGGRKNHVFPAHADLAKRDMLAPKPVTREKLYVFLHECGHFILRHFQRREATTPLHRRLYSRDALPPRHVYEFEAEQFAISTMRREGVPVPRAMLGSAKAYIKNCIRHDRKRSKRMRIDLRV